MAVLPVILFSLVLLIGQSTANPFLKSEESDPSEPGYRLNKYFRPIDYRIQIEILDKFEEQKKGVNDRPFKGTTIIKVKKETEATSNVLQLHMDKFIANKKILKITIGNTPIDTYDYKEETEILQFEVDAALIKPKGFDIEFQYEGHIYDDMYGIYLSNYFDDNKKPKYIATTQFQPSYARRAFPCFDEPEYKAKFKISVEVPAGYHAVGNQLSYPIQGSVDENKRQKFVFNQTPNMSTYLVAFIVSDFEATKAAGPDQLKMKVWAPKNLIKNAKYAADISWNILKKIEKILDPGNIMPYFPKMNMDHLDTVAIPDLSAGAMENWGLMTFRDTALLVDAKNPKMKEKERVATLIAHEFSHNWFGNWVTTHWWSDAWLNEGFALYFESHCIAEMTSDDGVENFDMRNQFVLNDVHPVLETDGNEGALPLSSKLEDVNTVDDIKAKFGTITYSKGGSIVRMMERLVTKEIFMGNLNKYLLKASKKAPSITTTEDLFTEFGNIDGIEFNKIMKEWIEESGYPLITVSLDDGKVVVRQEQFLYSGTGEKKWNVPITYKTEKIDKESTTTPDPSGSTTEPSSSSSESTESTTPPPITPPTTTLTATEIPTSTDTSPTESSTPTDTDSTVSDTTPTSISTSDNPTPKSSTPDKTEATPPVPTQLPDNPPGSEEAGSGKAQPESYQGLIHRNKRDANERVKILKKRDEKKIILDNLGDDEAIFINPENEGFYRVKYDQDLLERINQTLRNNHTKVSVVTRAQLINDIMNLARADPATYSESLYMLAYLEEETDYYPWRAAFTAFSYLRKRLVDDSVLDKNITDLMEKLGKKLFDENDKFTISEMEEPIGVYTRVMALEWACEIGVQTCLDNAKNLFQKTTRDKEEANVNLQSVVLCAGLRHSSQVQEDWDETWRAFEAEKNAARKITYLTALGCTKEKAILKDYLERSLDRTKIRPQDALSVFKAVLTGNPEGIQIAQDFLLKEGNLGKIRESYGTMGALSTVISLLADRLTTETQVQALKVFIDDNANDIKEVISAARNALEAADANIKWAETAKTVLKEHFNGACSLMGVSFLGLILVSLVARLL